MKRAAVYKPLLFTTTLRNPERMKWHLEVLKKYDGIMLSNELATDIVGELIRLGLYRPMQVSSRVKNKFKTNEPLTDDEIQQVLRDNPQNHKEAGFEKGWPSRFDTEFEFAKELGFVYYKIGEAIKFSEMGLKLIDAEHPEFEQQVFLNAFTKYQRNNPFRRVLNENAPLILLLEVIQKINSDQEFNSTGLSRLEISLLIYWKDSDAQKLYLRIKKLRQEYGFSPSWEVISDICRNEIMEGNDIVRNVKSIIVDYPDEFIRKMRLTGLISLRGGGRFIDINQNELEKVKYVLEQYSNYKKFQTEEEYFDYISTVDKNLVSLAAKEVSHKDQNALLAKWLSVFQWEAIKSELLILRNKRLSSDEVLKYLSNPIRLEFLTALAIKTKFPNIKVSPNYPVDDEGLPTSTAGGVGDTGDIECFENSDGVLVEVTMSEGRIQTMMEVWPIARHLENFSKKANRSMCLFVAPSIFKDSTRQMEFLKNKENLKITPKTIEDFIEYIENNSKLYSIQ